MAAPTPWRDRLSDEAKEQFAQGRAVLLPQDGPCAFATSSGKLEFLRPELPHPLPCYLPDPSGSYPLRLVVAPHQATLNSSFSERDELVKARGPMRLVINEADAAARGIADGAVIDVWNDLAHVHFYAEVRSSVAPGAVVAEGVYSAEQSLNGLTVNALMSEALTDGGRAATLCGNTVDAAPV